MDVSQTPGPVLAFAVVGLYVVIWLTMAALYWVGFRLAGRILRITDKKES